MDHTNFGPDGPIESKVKGANPTWWDFTGDDAANGVTAVLTQLEQAKLARQLAQIRDARLYGNNAQIGFFAGVGYVSAMTTLPFQRERLSYNGIQSVIDTVVSRIGKSKPKPMFLTSGGNYREQRKAKKLNKFCDGIFYENGAYVLGPIAFRDACVWGDGVVKVLEKNDRVVWERTMPGELVVDELEGFNGKPRQMHQVKDVDRGVLLKAFPKKAALIRGAKKSAASATAPNVIADLITVRESWHLPSGPGAKDGAHFISIEEGALTDVAEWKHDFFPFARFGWSPRLYGFWSQGLAEQLMPMQLELNRLLATIQRATSLTGTIQVWVERGSKIVKSQIVNEVGMVGDYTGKPPVFVTPPAVAPELYQQVETIIRRMYEQAGVSMMAAQSEKPAGLDSGKALRTFNDIESDRFQTPAKRYEDFFLELAKLSIETARAIAERNGGSYPVKVPGRGKLSRVDWKDIELSEDAFLMQCYPVSSLPSDPSGRLQTVQEYMQAGIYSLRVGMKLLDFPDLQAEDVLLNATEQYLEMVFDKMIDDGEYTPPDPLDDLRLGREMALEYYAYAKTQGVEDEKLGLIITFLEQIDEVEQDLAMKAAQKQAEAQMAAQPPPPPGGPAPMAVPEAPPTSALLPNVPPPMAMQ